MPNSGSIERHTRNMFVNLAKKKKRIELTFMIDTHYTGFSMTLSLSKFNLYTELYTIIL